MIKSKYALRLLCGCAAIFMFVCLFSANEAKAETISVSGSFNQRISQLKEIFKSGSYWNHWSASELGNYQQTTYVINGHTTTVSTKPCSKHTGGAVNSSCNHYWGSWGGAQCLGFGRMMFEFVWNMDPETEAYALYYLSANDDASCLDYIKPGDLIWNGTHARFITAVNGDTFTFVDCNWDNHCKVEWDKTITKSKIHEEMKKNKSGYTYSPTPVKMSESICDWYTYEVFTGMNVRRWASTSVKIETKMNKGDTFYADLNHTITKSGKQWAYIRTPSGYYGWTVINDTSLCKKIEKTTVYSNTINDGHWHYYLCTSSDPNTCYLCGATTADGIEIYEKHTGESIIGYDTDSHWSECADCGALLSGIEAHVAACTDPNTCVVCEQSVSDGINLYVFHAQLITLYDENSHWYHCDACGVTSERESHYIWNGECIDCHYILSDNPNRLPGDVTGDGKVNLSDVVRLLKYVSNWDVTINEANSDVTGDGKITLSDVVRLLKYVSNWDVTLE